MPVLDNKESKTFQMVTEIFPIENTNVDYASSKIRHLISKSAKLVTDKESNSIVITDFPQNIATIKKVISIISKDSKKYIKIVKLKNIKAANVLGDLKSVAKTIYNEKITKEKVDILLNKDTNSIMFVGKKKNVDYLVKYLQNIDNDGSMIAKTVNVIYLKNAESKNVIKMLQGIIANKKYKDPNKKPYVSSDEESNSIILMGQKDELDYFKELISKLDIDRQQVYVKARIIEVSEKRTRDVGIKYGLTGSIANSNGLTSISAALSENYSLPSIPLVSSSGSVINKDVLAMGVSINLLNQNGAADIVSEPSLLCINNKKSSIYVGQTVSIKTATNTSTGGVTNDSFKREDVGLTLAVKPRISNGGKVLLEISTKVEDVSKSDGANGQPDTSKKELSTSAIVNNGESVILGGYIKETKSNTEDKVPFFGDIPILGALFRSNREVKDKINLVIIITPYIVPKSKDLTYIRNQLAQLKILEDKYTKDTILRLKQAKLKSKQDDIIRDEEVKQIDKTQKALSSKKKSNNTKKSEKSQREQLDQEVKQMFGI